MSFHDTQEKRHHLKMISKQIELYWKRRDLKSEYSPSQGSHKSSIEQLLFAEEKENIMAIKSQIVI